MKAEYVMCVLIALTNLYRCLHLPGSTDEDDDSDSNHDACSFAMHKTLNGWLSWKTSAVSPKENMHERLTLKQFFNCHVAASIHLLLFHLFSWNSNCFPFGH